MSHELMSHLFVYSETATHNDFVFSASGYILTYLLTYLSSKLRPNCENAMFDTIGYPRREDEDRANHARSYDASAGAFIRCQL